MKVIENNSSKRIVPLIVLNTLLLTAAVFSYESLPFGADLIRYSTSLITLLLSLGFIGFYYRNNSLIFFNFAACIVICSVLRTLPSQQLSSGHLSLTDITVAHFVVEDSQSLAEFKQHQPSVQVDFMSIQTSDNTGLEPRLAHRLEHKYPFNNTVSYNDGFKLHIFSTLQLKNLDTIIDPTNNSISLFGSILLDSSLQEITFLSSSLPSKKTAQRKPNLRSDFIGKLTPENFSRMPANALLVSNPLHISSPTKAQRPRYTEPVVDKFSANDRTFYSKDLICTKFRKSCQGNCVISSYRVKNNRFLTNNTALSPSFLAGSAL
jgi:hypothetical protein